MKRGIPLNITCKLEHVLLQRIGVPAIFCLTGLLTICPNNSCKLVAQIFTKQTERNGGHTMQQLHRPTYEEKIFLQLKLSYELINHVLTTTTKILILL